MIKLQNQVPMIYSSASRDFQYIGWLMDIMLNAVKHDVDDLYNLPHAQANSKLIELLALTLGFKVKRNYDQKQLNALAKVIPLVLKYKGTAIALEIAGSALLKAAGSSGSFKYSANEEDPNLLEILIPKDLVDATLFTDLLPYILPAGMTCRIAKRTELEDIRTTYVDLHESIWAKWYTDLDNTDKTGLTGLFDNTTAKPDFANFVDRATSKDDKTPTLNAGLLANTIIPRLEDQNALSGEIKKSSNTGKASS